MIPMSKRVLGWLVVALVAGLGLGWYVLITPGNPLTRMFQRTISDVNARIIVGPYPEDRDFELLKRNDVGMIVTLLNPAIPYENTLLEREKRAAAKYGIELKSFPMSSILGQRFGSEYDTNAAAAAEAIATAPGKVYLHCYLGRHRIKVVRDLLAQRGVESGMYTVRQSERDDAAVALDEADAHFKAGRFQDALMSLGKIDDGQETGSSRVLRAWSNYRSGSIAEARAAFTEVRQKHPANTQAPIGLGYCAYRDGDVVSAETFFREALTAAPEDADALAGLGLTLYRAGNLADAKLALEAALKAAPGNRDVSDALARIK
jgi:Flp pilus assembly protein TadD